MSYILDRDYLSLQEFFFLREESSRVVLFDFSFHGL